MNSTIKKPIYLDYNATTPVDPRVLEAMLPYFQEHFGNAASTSHSYGWEADLAVTKARKQVAALIGAFAKEIYFTSGATESNNIILQGLFWPYIRANKKSHLITSNVEHKCVLDTALALEKEGVALTILPADRFGQVHPEDVLKAIRPETKLVSLIFGNNEIGSLNPVREIGGLLKEKGIPFHSDAAQAIGKIPLSVTELNVDFLSGSTQKMYGPKGSGFMYRRLEGPHAELSPIFFGGQQEKGLRPGTLNVPGIVGLGSACQIFNEELTKEFKRLTDLQTRFCQKIQSLNDGIVVNGHPTQRLPTNLSLTFNCLTSDILSMGLGGLAVSSGSACSMGEPSHVLKAIGKSSEEARKTIRIGIGRFTTQEDMDQAAEILGRMIVKNSANSAT